MAVQTSSEVESCTVCLEAFQLSGNNEPKLLQCLHTFCHGCLDELRKNNNNKITCPICRHMTKDKVESLPSNTLALKRLNETTDYVFQVLKKSIDDAEKVRTALEVLNSDLQISSKFRMDHLEVTLTCLCRYCNDSCRDYAIVKVASSFIYHLLMVSGDSPISSSMLSKIVDEELNALRRFPFGDELKEHCLSILKDTRIFADRPTNFVDATNVFVQSLINLTSQPLRERILRFLWDVRNGMSIAEAKDVSTPDLFKKLLQFISCGGSEKISPTELVTACRLICDMVFRNSRLNNTIVSADSLSKIRNIFMDKQFPPSAKHSLMVALTNCSDRLSTRLQMLKDLSFLRSLQHLLKSDITNSYPYAYAIAMALLEPQDNWTGDSNSSLRSNMATDLYSAILTWNSSVNTGMIFHDVKNFLPLLNRSDVPAVQLFTAWTLKHLCESDESYRAMLLSCGGVGTLNNVRNNITMPEDAKAMIECVLRLLMK